MLIFLLWAELNCKKKVRELLFLHSNLEHCNQLHVWLFANRTDRNPTGSVFSCAPTPLAKDLCYLHLAVVSTLNSRRNTRKQED